MLRLVLSACFLQLENPSLIEQGIKIFLELILFSSLQEKESWEMNNQEKIEAAGKKKEEGNVLFKAGKIERASKRYEKVCCI